MDSEGILVTIKNTATITGCGISLFTFLGIIIKPLRTRVFKWFVKATHLEEIKMLDKRVTNLENKNNQILYDISKKIDELAKQSFEDIKDRLKGELFNCGNRCRRGIPLTLEEFRYIQEVYDKYNGTLHCNHNGTEEYEYIRDYFNSIDNQEKINIK